ncbi:MAG TPA: CapA family protein, partial [Candidatus Paceibacterota bacterium]|nr:CapA family protein [Candidatus Paceibacterota bacterium]
MLAHLMGAVVGAFIAVAVSIFGPIREGAIVPASIPAPQEAPSPREAPRILFVGDVMLGRRVETLANEYGASYPFRHVSDEVALADYAVANFEGTVSDPHVHTPDLTYRFSVSEDLFREVKGSGFDAISLANNHSLDYGVPAFLNTTRLCERYGIVCGGDASSPNLASTTVARIGGERVGFLYLVAIGDDPVDIESVRSLMDELRGASDFQVALVH